MSYARIAEYLSQGGFNVITPYETYKELKKTCKFSAKIEYRCPQDHKLSITYASFKNKKSKHKNNFEGFCSKCKSGRTLKSNTDTCNTTNTQCEEQEVVNENNHNTFSSCETETNNHIEEFIEQPIEYLDEDDVDTCENENDYCEESTNDEICEVNEDKVVVLNDYSSKYIDCEPEFIGYYLQRRNDLCKKYKLFGDEVFNISKHIDLVRDWLSTNKNIVTGTTLRNEIIETRGNILTIDSVGLRVVVQTTLVHNLDPEIYSKSYVSSEKTIVFLLNGEEIIDVWYIIPGKRYYSICHKYSFKITDKIQVSQVRDEDEYFFLEYFMFHNELVGA